VGNKKRADSELWASSFELGPDPPMAGVPERLSDMERAGGALWSDD
jgi:hypothetical protein